MPVFEKLDCGCGSSTPKGAGMIEPNMATMLAFLATDLDVSSKILDRILPKYTIAEQNPFFAEKPSRKTLFPVYLLTIRFVHYVTQSW